MLALKSRDDIFSLHAAAVVSAELLLTSITMYLCISLAYTNAPCVRVWKRRIINFLNKRE